MRPTSQIVRFSSVTDPGTTASAVVVTPHVAPTVVAAVAAHGTVIGNGVSDMVARSTGEEPFTLSVIRSGSASWSSPV